MSGLTHETSRTPAPDGRPGSTRDVGPAEQACRSDATERISGSVGRSVLHSLLPVRFLQDGIQSVAKSKYWSKSVNPRPAGVFGQTPNTPAGYSAFRGGGRFCSLSNSQTDDRRKTRKLSTKALNKTNLRNTKNFAYRGQVKDQNYRFPHYWLPSPIDAALIGAIHPERVQNLVRRGAVLEAACKGQDQGQIRSPKVICWTG